IFMYTSLVRGLPVALASMALPALAALAATMPAPSVTILSPAAGSTVTASEIPVAVAAKDFTVECAHVGQPGSPGRGHFHVMLDGMTMDQLTNFYCSNHFTLSGAGLKPGKHELAVVLATDAHDDASKPAVVSFSYEPRNPQLLPAPKVESGKPSVAILSPAAGAAVGKQFDLKLAVRHFTASCDLEGRSNIAGYGHIHVFVTQAGVTDKPSWKPEMAMSPMGQMKGESPKGGEMKGGEMKGGEMKGGEMQMMSMVGMIGMPCTTTVPVDLSAWHQGKAKIVVMLVGNDHNPLPGLTPAAITVNVR
ncbi:MAG: hypothetical protein KGM44_01855, partial [bacterium]|nr:hypothetical protein [bacterium]